MHHLHNSPRPYLSLRREELPSREELPQKKAVPRASLAALQWAAERAEQSYGRFTQGLTAGEQAWIQEEYEAWRAGAGEGPCVQ